MPSKVIQSIFSIKTRSNTFYLCGFRKKKGGQSSTKIKSISLVSDDRFVVQLKFNLSIFIKYKKKIFNLV